MKELTPGANLAHYRIVSKLGAGGMGEVYLAHDTKLDRKVALKILSSDVAADADRMRRFVQEARAAAGLNHPNIAHIYEIGEHSGTNYIAMEYIDGQTLRYQMTKRLSLPTVIDLAIQIASALVAAHQAGIVHRDIKPENVMLRRDGIIKVLDFGLAKLIEEEAVAELDLDAATQAKVKTNPGAVMGTPQYMSPEQVRALKVDARTDIFSLGVMLYEIIAGRPPFEGVNSFEVIGAILNREPQPLKTYEPNLPEELSRITSKALRKDREQRYQHIKDFLIDLTDLRQELEFEERLKVRQAQPDGGETKSGEQKGATTTGVATAVVAAAATTSSTMVILGEIKRHKLSVALTLILVLVAAGGYFVFFGGSRSGPISSLAVMPFVNASGNADAEYLSDGMTETLINSLSQVPNLNVKARTSVFRYKGKEIDLQKIAHELKVQAILTGRVVEHGDQLTLSLELADARTENVIWGQQYNRKQSDLISLQSAIAHDVSSKLKTKLSGADEHKVEKTYTGNPEAYRYYLQGRFYWNKRGVDGLRQAAEYYQQAIDKDPNFALAWSGLAETYVLFSNYSVAPPAESMRKAKAAALKALELDDSLAEPHAALGIYSCGYVWDQSAAEEELRRAIELNPNYATAYQWLADVLSNQKRPDEAIAAIRRAEELDPLSPVISADTGFNLILARRYDEAIAQLQRTLLLDPNFHSTQYTLAWAYYEKGKYSEAISVCRRAQELNDQPDTKAILIASLAKSGQRAEATKLLNELKSETANVPNYYLAVASIALGDKGAAFAALDKDLANRAPTYSIISVDPLFDDLRDDPRFTDLMRRVAQPKSIESQSSQ